MSASVSTCPIVCAASFPPSMSAFPSDHSSDWKINLQPIPLTRLFLPHGHDDENNKRSQPRKRYPRPPHYNSNDARSRQRRELQELREVASELEKVVEELQQKRIEHGKPGVLGIWEGIALQQRKEIRRAQEENERLKNEVGRQEQIITCMQRVLELQSSD